MKRNTTSLMFTVDGTRIPTWNPLGGRCGHECIYCWAMGSKGLVTKYKMTKYEGVPRLVPKELTRAFVHDIIYFVCDMTDLMANIVPSELINTIFNIIRNNPQSRFLLLTKNPKRYNEFIAQMPENIILGTTIETNKPVPSEISKAPSVLDRYAWFRSIKWHEKWVSIEPVMEFDLAIFTTWLKNIAPKVVYIGYDNYGNNLPEPALIKVQQFISVISSFTEVRTKTLRERCG